MLRKEIPTNYFKNKDLLFQIIDWQEFDQSVEVKDEDTDEENQDVDYSFSITDSNKSYKKKPYKKREFLKKQMIRGYGVTDEGHSICVNVLDFQSYFYLSLPEELTIQKNFDLFINILKDTAGDWHSKGLVSAELVERKVFYGFTNNQLFKYAKFTFHSSMAYNGFKMKLLKETFRISRLDKTYDLSKNLCETKVKSMLRFFHTQNIDPAGWMKIKKGNYERNIGICEDKFDLNNKHSRCQIEVNCVYNKIEKVEKNSIGKVLVASFDLECVSDDGSFPKASNPLNPVIQIGTTVYEFGNRECKLSYIATLGACDPIENVIVQSFKSEKELILGWAKFIAKLDPDILTGYNIWGFDWKYLYHRSETGNGGLISPYIEQLFNILQRSSREKKVELTEQKLSSSALGDNFLYYIDIEGIVQIDLFKVMQRDYKLDSYKLDNVAQFFMKMQKEDLPYKQLFANYKRGTSKDIQEIAIYCIKDCDLVNRLIDDRQVLVSNIGMANVCVVPFSYLFLKGQGIKIFSLVAKITREEGFVVKDLNDDDIDKASYEGAIVFVPEPGVYFEPVVVMDYNSLYPSSMIAENISHDSIVGFKEYRLKSQMIGFKKEDEESEVKASKIKNMLKAGIKKYEEEEKNKITKKKNGNLQDSSNLVCNESNCILIKNTVVQKYDNLPEFNYIEITYDVFEGISDNKHKIGYKTCRFAESKNGEKALLPRILRVLLKARKDTRKKMEYQNIYMNDGTVKVGIVTTSDKRAVISEIDPKADPNDFYLFEEDKKSTKVQQVEEEEYNVFNVIDGTYKIKKCDITRVEDTYNQGEIDVLEGLQIAYKVVCNSLYGQVGASTSPICYKELAACTTATGRNMVIHARDTTLKTFKGTRLTYGDTDSIFVNFTDYIKQKYPDRTFTEEELLEESIKVGQEAAKNVNKDIKAPQNIEYEKTFWPFVIFSKKRYFGNKYEKSIKKYKETSMGIVLKRRDNAQILKSIYKGIIDIILNKRDLAGSKLFFREAVKNLLEGNVDISQLVISKTIKSDYANPTQIAHKVLADRMGERDEGNKPQSNDRIPYCYIDPHNLKCSMCKGKINEKNCKCNTCMKIFCFQHMGNHRSKCTPVCRFCKVTDKMLESDSYQKPNDWPEDKQYKLEKCLTCTAHYCPKCFPKHKMQKDKYGVINHNKCKKAIVPKLLQGDLIEIPQYIQEEKLKIDFMYYFEHQIMKPVYQIFELDMARPESIVHDLIVAYNNKKNGSRSISDFFGKPVINTLKKKKTEDSDEEIEMLLPKSKSKKIDENKKETSPISSFDTHDIKVNDELKKEIMRNIEITIKKKTVMTIADNIPDAEDEGGGVEENTEDINLALEMFEDIEDLRRDINDID